MNPGGFAFILREDGRGSLFVPPTRLGGALDGDLVLAEVQRAERGDEGHVVGIERRGRTRIVGILERAGNRTWRLVADDPRILHRIHLVDEAFDATPGSLVAAKIVEYPGPGEAAIGVRIDRELGPAGELESESQRILLENGIEERFPKAALKEAKHVPQEVRERDRKGRADLRHLDFMTIDPPDARDFDDAVTVQVLGDDLHRADMRLWVAVADVSHYVRPGSEIDNEALLRCFSVYLPERAIPMLPEQLSSHMCSLVEQVDRLAMVVAMTVDAAGMVSDVEAMASVIHSRKRLTYDQVAKVLQGDDDEQSPEVQTRVRHLRECADRLRRVRLARGAVELSLPESKIVLDQDDRTRIRAIVQTRADPHVARAYNLIEELMLAANESIGQLGVDKDLPVVYRVHDMPDGNKLEQLARAAEAMGVEVDPEELKTPKGMQRFLARLEGEPKLRWLNGLMLRSMAQAEYRSNNVGHFALASPAYVHFTSPIRRYADLISHRVIKAYLAQSGGFAGGSASAAKMPKRSDVTKMAFDSSWRERSIANVERHTKSLYAAAFMRDRLGDRFAGTVSGVSPAGVFVALDDPFVDGFVALGETQNHDRSAQRWLVDESGVRMVASGSGRMLSLGDAVDVEVVDVSLSRRRIELRLVGQVGQAQASNEAADVGGRRPLRRKTGEGEREILGSKKKTNVARKPGSASSANRRAEGEQAEGTSKGARRRYSETLVRRAVTGAARDKVAEEAPDRRRTAPTRGPADPRRESPGKRTRDTSFDKAGASTKGGKSSRSSGAKPAKSRAPIAASHPAKKTKKRK